MDDPTELESFHDPIFLQSQALTPDNVVDYFCNSKFFDTNSLNQKRRRGLRIPQDADGIEYRLVSANAAAKNLIPALNQYGGNASTQLGVFVIQKISRTAGTETPLRCYCVLGGVIYPAPSLANAIHSRMRTACQYLKESLDILTSMNHWTLLSGHSWCAPLDLEGDLASTSEEADNSEPSTPDMTRMDGPGSTPLDTGQCNEPNTILSLSRVSDHYCADESGSAARVIIHYEHRQLPHYLSVLEAECRRLCCASDRLRDMFQAEAGTRFKVENHRRDKFANIMSWLDDVDQAMSDAYMRSADLKFWLPDVSSSNEAEQQQIGESSNSPSFIGEDDKCKNPPPHETSVVVEVPLPVVGSSGACTID